MLATASLLTALLALVTPEPVVTQVEVKVRLEVTLRVVTEDDRPAGHSAVFLEGEGGALLLLEAGEDGVARGMIELPEEGRLRVAATSGDAWTLSGWQSLDSARNGLVLKLGPAGTLALESRERSGALHLETGGWDLAELLGLLGAGPEVYAGTPLLVAGLPVGEYVVTLGEASRQATVRPRTMVRVTFD